MEHGKAHDTSLSTSLPLQVELTGSSVFDYVHPGDHVEMAEQLGMKLPPGRGLLSQGTTEDAASSASSSSQSETPEPGGNCKPNMFAVGDWWAGPSLNECAQGARVERL